MKSKGFILLIALMCLHFASAEVVARNLRKFPGCSSSSCAKPKCGGRKQCYGDSNVCKNKCNVNVVCAGGVCDRPKPKPEPVEPEPEPEPIEPEPIQPEPPVEPVLPEPEEEVEVCETCTTYSEEGFSDIGSDSAQSQTQEEWTNEWANDYQDSGTGHSEYYQECSGVVSDTDNWKYDYSAKGADKATLDKRSSSKKNWSKGSVTNSVETEGVGFEKHKSTTVSKDDTSSSGSSSSLLDKDSKGASRYNYVYDPECDEYHELKGGSNWSHNQNENSRTKWSKRSSKDRVVREYSSTYNDCEVCEGEDIPLREN